MTLKDIRSALKEHADKEYAGRLQSFFRTGPGEYGEGDVFAGVRVPDIRRVARKYSNIKLQDIGGLLRSPVHEERFLALVFLVKGYISGNESRKARIYDFYLDNISRINNWDLVDSSAPYIMGAHLMDKDRSVLYSLARSDILWERRISIMSTFYFINENDFSTSIDLAEILLSDKEDLIHKAVGWMLREIGKRKLPAEEVFLKKHFRNMPRVMLRYAIEKFPEPLRKSYLNGRA